MWFLGCADDLSFSCRLHLDVLLRNCAMTLQINATCTRLQMGPINIALRRHAILSLICWLACLFRSRA
jgi:hypothetical protein